MAGFVGNVPHIAFDLAPEEASVGTARRAITAFAAENGASDDLLGRVAIALSEALSNAVSHAFAEHGGSVQIAADVEDGDLEVVVADDGLGLRPGDGPGLGLGLLLIERCSDVFLVRNRLPQGVEVWMRFWLR
jgi:anti-sigma regulatory factor (Ser/Thr protein kinase)